MIKHDCAEELAIWREEHQVLVLGPLRMYPGCECTSFCDISNFYQPRDAFANIMPLISFEHILPHLDQHSQLNGPP